MARTVQVHLLDDIDGSPADETVTFSLDGITYEIDLSSEHSEQLRAAVAKYIVAGRRAPRGVVAPGAGKQLRSREGSTGRADRNQNQAIREWAKRTGIEISDRGRIPASVVERYRKDTN
jgi:hypothetical protein